MTDAGRRRRPVARLSRATAVVLAAGGCQQGATVTIDQSGGQVVATLADAPEGACVADVTVVEEGGLAGDRRSIWRVAMRRAERCVARLVLGEVPAGYAEEAPMMPLIPGRRYGVGMTGSGFAGAASFTAAVPPATRS